MVARRITGIIAIIVLSIAVVCLVGLLNAPPTESPLLEGEEEAKLDTEKQTTEYLLDQDYEEEMLEMEKKMTQYLLVLGGEETKLDMERQKFTSHGGYIEGRVCLYINGNPVLFYSGGAIQRHVNGYLKQGNNTFDIEGSFKHPLRCTVVTTTAGGMKYDKILHESLLMPQDGTKRIHVADVAVESYRNPLYDKSTFDSANKEDIKKSVLKILKNIYASLKKKDTDYFAQMLSQGEKIVLTPYPEFRRDKKWFTRALTYWEDINVREDPLDEKELIWLFGDNSVLVYVDFPEQSDFPYISSYKGDPFDKYLGAMQFACIEGKWVIWRYFNL